VLFIPHEMLQFIHTGLPWYAALPVSAFVLRGALTLFFGARVRASTARYVGLHPLRQALASQIRHKLRKTVKYKSPGEARRAIAKDVLRQTRALDKRWDCSLGAQLGWTFLQLPVFLTMAELIRCMCNANEGLLGMAVSAFGTEEQPALSHGVDMQTNLMFEPSLAHEGMLWFPNLILPDPTGTLPYILSAVMFTNVYFTNNTPGAIGKMPKPTTIVRRTLLGVALLIGPLAQEVPAAMLLYWASSTTSVLLWNLWLDRRYPAPKGFEACSRPLMLTPQFQRQRV